MVLASPLALLDHHLLTAHMLQHLLLMIVAAPLILLGARGIVLARRMKIISAHPIVCWLAGTVTVIAWHVPAVFELALQSHFLHEFEQVSFFIAGILFWWPVILPASSAVTGWSVPLYLFFATLPCDALSAFLVFCGHVVYPPYLCFVGHSRLSPLEDQALAGALMWVTVTFAYLIPALAVTAKLLSGGPERAAGVEADYFLSDLEIGAATRPSVWERLRAAIPDFWTLTKPEVNFLIIIAAGAGFYLGCPTNLPAFPFGRLLNALFGTLLVASGTGALNQYLEFRFDARMRRTCRRPVASGRLRPAAALWFGISLAAIGGVYLLITVNALASALAVLTLVSYLLVYTPLKRKTPLCTLVGALPGAAPPLIGWAAASGSLSGQAWILYALLFLWQFPHFMAIAWMYREDYARAGYLIFPTRGEESFLNWQTLGPSCALFVAGIAAVAANRGSIYQYSGAVLLGAVLLYYARHQVLDRSKAAARQLLKVSIFYLPLQFLILVLGKA
jgi:protoheme IX farnesyltransferase